MQNMKDKIFLHYKGGVYKVLECGIHTETEEKMVVYKRIGIYKDKKFIPLYDNKIWIRPYCIWSSSLHYMNKLEIQRFTEVDKNTFDKEYLKLNDTLNELSI